MAKDEALKYYATKQHMTIDGTENGEVARKALADQADEIKELNEEVKELVDRINTIGKSYSEIYMDMRQLKLDNAKLRKVLIDILANYECGAKVDTIIAEALSTTNQPDVLNNQTTQKSNHACRYSRAMNQSYPRKCLDCNKAETHGIPESVVKES